MEGGPLVLEVSLEYKGNTDVDIRMDGRRTNSHIDSHAKWRSRIRLGAFHRGGSGQQKLSPGDRLSEILYAHQQFCDLVKGKAVLEVSWRIFEPTEEGKVIARPTTRVEVDLLPATEDRLRALCGRLLAKLDQPARTEEERRQRVDEVLDYLQNTNHTGLVPVLWRLLESAPDACPMTDFLQQIYAGARDKSAVNRRLVKLACDPDYPGQGRIFAYWRWEPPPPAAKGDDKEMQKFAKMFCDFDRQEEHWERVTLSAEEVAPLLRCKSVWIRAMTSVTFPDQCDRAWTEQLFRDLRESQQPLPEKLFARLLADLDDDDFTVRQQATEDLERHGDRVQAQISKALQGQPSPEVKDRLKRVLEESAKGPPRIVRVTLPQLEHANTAPSRAILRVLAEGQTDSWATREAKAALQRLSKP
jgi:hypothetical protein